MFRTEDIFWLTMRHQKSKYIQSYEKQPEVAHNSRRKSERKIRRSEGSTSGESSITQFLRTMEIYIVWTELVRTERCWPDLYAEAECQCTGPELCASMKWNSLIVPSCFAPRIELRLLRGCGDRHLVLKSLRENWMLPHEPKCVDLSNVE